MEYAVCVRLPAFLPAFKVHSCIALWKLVESRGSGYNLLYDWKARQATRRISPIQILTPRNIPDRLESQYFGTKLQGVVDQLRSCRRGRERPTSHGRDGTTAYPLQCGEIPRQHKSLVFSQRWNKPRLPHLGSRIDLSVKLSCVSPAFSSHIGLQDASQAGL
jgi:hypothetical protein